MVIGLTARRNEDGARQLAHAAEPLGYRPFQCPVEDRLHLATAVTAVGPNLLIGTAAGVASLGPARDGAQTVVIPDEEVPAANVLAMGDRCLVAMGYPRAAAALRQAGRTVIEVALGEFTKADGGPTCLVAVIP